MPFSVSDLQQKIQQKFPTMYPSSFVTHLDAAFWLQRKGDAKQLVVLARDDNKLLDQFEGERSVFQSGYAITICPTDHANARALRHALDWLTPKPIGLATSAGTGDRLGLATPGHVRAFNAVGGNIVPIFAQQSIREMQRTGRSAEDVMTDATFGTFEAGWRKTVGADADHLKVPEDIDICMVAGYTFYTIDPGAYVDSEADTASTSVIQQKMEALPWKELLSTPADFERRYVGKKIDLETCSIEIDSEAAMRAAAKYGKAIAHVANMYMHLVNKRMGVGREASRERWQIQQDFVRDPANLSAQNPSQVRWANRLRIFSDLQFELEVSVDETETPTTHAEHIIIASELKRLNVRWVSIAPRYVGRFEKGVDYIGDPSQSSGEALKAFEKDFAIHAEIARKFGPYKLSIHSGSDKFSVYPITMEQTRGMVHLKTAGTSYLEALRTIAAFDPSFFRSIYVFARDRYTTDRATYHVSAELARAPKPDDVKDADLPALLNQFDAREILHVTFGSVLTTKKPDGKFLFYDDFMSLLRAHPEEYAENLKAHFIKHLKPFAKK